MLFIQYTHEHIDKFEKYYNKWKIKINVTKTELIIFSQRKRIEEIASLTINGVPINIKNEAKYLGVILDEKLKFTIE